MFEAKYPITLECLSTIWSVIRDMQLTAGIYHANIALNEYAPVLFLTSRGRFGIVSCVNSGLEASVVEAANRARVELGIATKAIEWNTAITSGDLKRARRILEYAVSALNSMGFGNYARDFQIIHEAGLNALKRGDLERLREVVEESEALWGRITYEYALRKMAGEYMILKIGQYSIILLNPPGKGLYEVPVGYLAMMEALSRIFPDNVKIIKNPDDIDSAFADAFMRIGERYSRHLLLAYLELNGLGRARDLALRYNPFVVISIVKMLKNGYYTVVRPFNGDVYEFGFPRARFIPSGDRVRDFINVISLIPGA